MNIRKYILREDLSFIILLFCIGIFTILFHRYFEALLAFTLLVAMLLTYFSKKVKSLILNKFFDIMIFLLFIFFFGLLLLAILQHYKFIPQIINNISL